MIVRPALVVVHRWSGLAIALVVTVAGLTGSILAFRATVDGWFAPAFYATPPAGARALDPVALRERALAQLPGLRFDRLDLSGRPGAWSLDGVPVRVGGAGGGQYAFDPVTGRVLAHRAPTGGWPRSPAEIVAFVYALHVRLAIPGRVGVWAFGLAAVVWTLDCFVGIALTFPRSQRGFWRHWGRAWRIKPGSRGFRLTFDLHRAVSLWFWVLLLPFAWSSVWQNLTTQVYQPVMQAVGFRFTDPDAATPPSRGVLPSPPVGFREAMAAGEVASRADAAAHGYRYISPFRLTYDIASGRYAFRSHVSLDPGEYGGLSVLIDGRDGRALQVIRSDLTRGDVVTNWLGSIHTADIVGSLLYRWIVVSVGVACALLSVTGVVVWLRKRNARLSRRKAMQP